MHNTSETKAVGFGYEEGTGLSFALLEAYWSKDFVFYTSTALFLVAFMMCAVTTIGVFVFKIDYTNVDTQQLRREFRYTIEATVTYYFAFFGYLTAISGFSWDSTNISAIISSAVINNLVFNFWFYFQHRLWHSNRTLYYLVHEHHHRSVIVSPLTALSNSWLESFLVSLSYVITPLLLPGCNYATNVYGWFLSQLLYTFTAILGHSRIPFTLEHALHHAHYNKNFSFFERGGIFNIDKIFGTWLYADESERTKKLYPKEKAMYK